MMTHVKNFPVISAALVLPLMLPPVRYFPLQTQRWPEFFASFRIFSDLFTPSGHETFRSLSLLTLLPPVQPMFGNACY